MGAIPVLPKEAANVFNGLKKANVPEATTVLGSLHMTRMFQEKGVGLNPRAKEKGDLSPEIPSPPGETNQEVSRPQERRINPRAHFGLETSAPREMTAIFGTLQHAKTS